MVCDASIKIMTECRTNASLEVSFDLHVQEDLREFHSVLCTTRFFDNRNMDPDPLFDGLDAGLKEHRTPCEYVHNVHGSEGCLSIKFGSKFWANRM